MANDMFTLKTFFTSSFGSLAVSAGLLVGSDTAYGVQPAVPKVQSSPRWQLAEGCRTYRLGLLTDPDCDILTGDGITIQITRMRPLGAQPGPLDRSTIGIEFRARRGEWSFSSPYAELLVGARITPPPEIDEAIVFAKGDKPSLQRLAPRRAQYQLPPDERLFFRLQFPIAPGELRHGFTLQITGLQRDGKPVHVPVLEFEFK